MRRLLESRGESVENLTVPIYVPVSLRLARGGGHEGGNLISQMVTLLPVGAAAGCPSDGHGIDGAGDRHQGGCDSHCEPPI